jgi:hypothetical protein
VGFYPAPAAELMQISNYMKSKLLYLLLAITLISCQREFEEISEKDKYYFFLENLIESGGSTAPNYVSFYIVNTDTSSYHYNEPTEICAETGVITYWLTKIDSTIIINGYWDVNKLLNLTKNRTLLVCDSIYSYLYYYSLNDTLQIEAIDLLVKKYSIKKLLIDYKDHPSVELSDSIETLISPFFYSSFRTGFQHYLFIHGIAITRHCEGRGKYIGGIYHYWENRIYLIKTMQQFNEIKSYDWYCSPPSSPQFSNPSTCKN